MLLDEKTLTSLNCEIYKYNFTKECFQIRNYFKTDAAKLVQEYDEIIKELVRNRIKFKVLKDNTILLNKE